MSWRARKQLFFKLIQEAQPTPETLVLDVGVTADRREDANFFEKLYPYAHNVTAVGLEDASFLQEECPGLTFVHANPLHLPFPDKSFDLVVSFSTIEHIGSRADQKGFVRELCRVGRTCYITTANRGFPIEVHSGLPLVHWLPESWFRAILKLLGKSVLAKEEALNLLSEKEMLSFFPQAAIVHKAHHKRFGLVSHLAFYLENPL